MRVQFCHAHTEALTLSQKVNTVFELKCAAKLNFAFGFVLKDVDGICRYYYAHENNTLMERSKLVATKEDLVKIKNVLSNTDVVEACSKEREPTKWKFYKLTNVTVFAALLREVPVVFKDAILTESLTKSYTVNCPTCEERIRKPYNENLWLFRALALHLHGNGGLEEENSKMFNLFLERLGGPDPLSFQGVRMNDLPIVEDLVQLNIFLYDIDIVDGAMILEPARESVGKVPTLSD